MAGWVAYGLPQSSRAACFAAVMIPGLTPGASVCHDLQSINLGSPQREPGDRPCPVQRPCTILGNPLRKLGGSAVSRTTALHHPRKPPAQAGGSAVSRATALHHPRKPPAQAGGSSAHKKAGLGVPNPASSKPLTPHQPNSHGLAGSSLIPDPIAIPDPMPAPSSPAAVRIG